MDDMTLLGIKAAVAAGVAALTAVWGWFGWLVVAWVLLMLSDWLIGSAAAARLALVQRQNAGGGLAQGWHDPGGGHRPGGLTGSSPRSLPIFPGSRCPLPTPCCWGRW